MTHSGLVHVTDTDWWCHWHRFMMSLIQTDYITDTDWWHHWYRLHSLKQQCAQSCILWLSNTGCEQTEPEISKNNNCCMSHFWFHSYQQGPSLLACLCMLTSNVRFQIYSKWTRHERSDLIKQAIMGHPKDRELVREAVQCEAIHHTKLRKFPPPPHPPAQFGHFC